MSLSDNTKHILWYLLLIKPIHKSSKEFFSISEKVLFWFDYAFLIPAKGEQSLLLMGGKVFLLLDHWGVVIQFLRCSIDAAPEFHHP